MLLKIAAHGNSGSRYGKVLRHRSFRRCGYPTKGDPAAILAYRRWVSEQEGETITFVHKRPATDEEVREVEELMLSDDPAVDPPTWWAHVQADLAEGLLSEEKYEIEEEHVVAANAVWAWVGDMIRQYPKQCARKTGIEELAYLEKVPKPVPAPSLEAIGQLYLEDKQDESHPKGIKNARVWWEEFVEVVGKLGVTRADQLDHDGFRHYANKIKADEKAPAKRTKKPHTTSYRRSRFGIVTTIFNYAAESGRISRELIARLAEAWKKPLIRPAKRIGKKYIFTPEHYRAILGKANDIHKAMILLGANCALYPIDLRRIEFSNVDLDEGTMVFRRLKCDDGDTEGIVRVGVLWKATQEALLKIRGDSERIFGFEHGNTPNAAIHSLCERAEIAVPYRAEDLRNTAATIAAKNAPEKQYKVLMGHKLPAEDAGYIEANPWFVQHACRAIGEHLGVEYHPHGEGHETLKSAARAPVLSPRYGG